MGISAKNFYKQIRSGTIIRHKLAGDEENFGTITKVLGDGYFAMAGNPDYDTIKIEQNEEGYTHMVLGLQSTERSLDLGEVVKVGKEKNAVVVSIIDPSRKNSKESLKIYDLYRFIG